MSKSIILYDGDCGICAGFVQKIEKKDTKNRFQCISIPSPGGRELLQRHSLTSAARDSLILIEHDSCCYRSTAVLRIARALGGFYTILSVLLILPERVRDVVYDTIAQNRHSWFSTKPDRKQCGYN
ncbi:thiol-disulfide oxidoreductase DCC family protein [candidate division KSB1 bacterium]